MEWDGMHSIMFHFTPSSFYQSKHRNKNLFHFTPFHSISFHQSKQSIDGMEWDGINLSSIFGLIKKSWNRVKLDGMHSISFHHFPSFFVPPIWVEWQKIVLFSYQIPKQWNRMTFLFHYAPFRSVGFTISKHNLKALYTFLSSYIRLAWRAPSISMVATVAPGRR